MGDYWQHWLEVGKKMSNPPKIFNVNWFRVDDDGSFIWPGFGENFRVIEWIIRRCKGEVGASESAIGYIPHPEDIDINGIDYFIHPGRRFCYEALTEVLTVRSSSWKKVVPSMREFFAKFGDRLPRELGEELDAMEKRQWLG
jgi:phosphoenolpyruvate carboxykinase (GTP)